MRKKSLATVAGATALLAGGGLVVGLGTSTADPSKDRPQAVAAATSMERAIGRQQAARVADRTVERRTGRPARVTGIGREDDFGARWEVEVTQAGGREFDVYVNASGKIVKVIKKGAADRGARTAAAVVGSPASQDWILAGTAARDAVEAETGEQVEVEGLEREDDEGTGWEVELRGIDSGAEFEVKLDSGAQVLEIETEDGEKEKDGDRDESGEKEDR